ncbi:MAG TPA: M23 family metallopeptidase [Acidobacteriota bacterium]|nr:M23 family metallopeptidase [Acidobacteriota bacterium]
MAKGDLNIIVKPAGDGPARKIVLPRRLVRLAAVGMIAFVAVLTLTALHYFSMWKHSEVHSEVGPQVERLRHENASFRHEARRLTDQFAFLETNAKKLEIMANVVQQTLSASGAENTVKLALDLESRRNVKRHLNAFDRRRINLTTEFQWLREKYADRPLLLSTAPSIWPAQGYLADVFGWRDDPFSQSREFHGGVDISGPQGTAVVATADGQVLRTDFTSDYGRLIIIDHRFGLSTRYAHLSQILVEEGARVKRGDVIGYVGLSGRATGPHVHYEVRLYGQPIDPLPFFQD